MMLHPPPTYMVCFEFKIRARINHEFSSGNRDIESWRIYCYLIKSTLSRAGVLKMLLSASNDLKLDQAALDG